MQQVFGEDINAATLRLLDRAGCEVVRLEQTPCCGAIEHHLGREGAALRRARGNARDWARQLAASEFSAIIVNASGCGTMLKEYAHLLRADPGAAQGAAAVSASVMDLSEFLQRSALAGSAERNPGRFTLAYQNPCSMQHGQRLRAVPPALLRSAGFKVIEAGDAHACCGSAGVYSLLQPDFAERLGQAKAARLRATGAHAVASGNLGCILQLRRYLDVPVLHTAQWLDWATGGPPAPGLAAIAGTD